MTLRLRGKTHDVALTYAVVRIASVMLWVAENDECFLRDVSSQGTGNL